LVVIILVVFNGAWGGGTKENKYGGDSKAKKRAASPSVAASHLDKLTRFL
jgi:hypothetical protein